MYECMCERRTGSNGMHVCVCVCVCVWKAIVGDERLRV
jgi:hypothetical protein